MKDEWRTFLHWFRHEWEKDERRTSQNWIVSRSYIEVRCAYPDCGYTATQNVDTGNIFSVDKGTPSRGAR